MAIIRLLLVLAAAVATVRADRDTTPIIPRAIASSNGAHFLLVTPVSERRDSWIWTVYAMGKTGAFKEVWSRDGTYAREIFLSDDGRYVVCVESWPTGHSPGSDTVIAIFDEGRLVRGYRPADLLRDIKSVSHSVSHYSWLAEWPPLFARGKTLFFTTIEGVAHELEMSTGKISYNLNGLK
jgi:hypothetical protein